MEFANLTGLTALVTGSSRGIGKEIAKKLKEAGAEVIISGTNEEALAKTAQELNVKKIKANLAKEEDIQNLAKEAGNVDILINNAGITRDGLFLRQSNDAWNEVLQVNLNAAVMLTRLLIKGMSKKRFGRIVNISSVVAHKGNTGQTNYITSKAAITGFTKGLAQEMGSRNITVNCVAPGFIETSMTAELSEKTMAEFKSQIPLKRFGTTQEVANAVLFFASKEASYITGTTLHVNGGLYS